MQKKLPVEEVSPNPEIEEILSRLKIKEGVVEPSERKISDKQKEHLEQIRVKALQAKKTKQEKLQYLEKYYIESQKKEINNKIEKDKYAKRKQKKAPPPPPIEEEEPTVEEDTDEEEIESEDLQPEYEEDESEEEEVVVIKKIKKTPVKSKPAKVVVPVKKKMFPLETPNRRLEPPPKRLPPPQSGGYNPFGGIMG